MQPEQHLCTAMTGRPKKPPTYLSGARLSGNWKYLLMWQTASLASTKWFLWSLNNKHLPCMILRNCHAVIAQTPLLTVCWLQLYIPEKGSSSLLAHITLDVFVGLCEFPESRSRPPRLNTTGSLQIQLLFPTQQGKHLVHSLRTHLPKCLSRRGSHLQGCVLKVKTLKVYMSTWRIWS